MRKLVVIAGIAALAFGQKKPELKARELFYVSMPAAPKPKAGGAPAKPLRVKTAKYEGPRPLGLRYSVVQVLSNGQTAEVPVATNFRTGDRVRVQVESNDAAFLYVVTQGSSGTWQVLFPSKEYDMDNHVQAGKPYVVPAPSHTWAFSGQAGEEKLFLVLSRTDVPDMEKLVRELGGSPQLPPTLLAQAIRPLDGPLGSMARDLILQKVDEAPAGQKAEAALYVVEKSGKPDARLVVEVNLKHQ